MPKKGIRLISSKIFFILFIAVPVIVLMLPACDSFFHLQYTIKFNANGGVPEPVAQIIMEGEKVSQPGNPSKTGFQFYGWYTDSYFISPYNFSLPVYKDMTLYARWQEDIPRSNVAIVIFNTNGAGEIPSRTVSIGAQVTQPTSPANSGYYLEAWYTDNDTFLNKYNFSSPVTGDLVLYARWLEVVVDPDIYVEVVWHSNEGIPTPTTTGRPLGSIIPESSAFTPTRTGFTFDGWYTDDGIWEEKFAFENGFSRPVYDPDPSSPYPPMHRLNLYAKWISNTATIFTITFESNGGTPVADMYIVDGESFIQPPDPEKDGYIFSGWYIDDITFENAYDFSDPVTANITLYANWEEIPVIPQFGTITFISNGGTGVLPRTVPIGNVVYKPDDPERYGHAFIGWYTDDTTFLDAYDFSEPVTGNFILYAKWEEQPFIDVIFKCNGGEISGETMINDDEVHKKVYLGEKITEPINNDVIREYSIGSPHRIEGTNYIFRGWYTDNITFLNEFDFSTIADNDITLYAKWLPDYMVKMDDPNRDFMMGSLNGDLGALASEQPQHHVIISYFYMSAFQVTRELWAYVMSARPEANLNAAARMDAMDIINPSQSLSNGVYNLPVETISWYEALVFCNRLSMIEGLEPVYRISNSKNPDAWGPVPPTTRAAWDRAEADSSACGFRMPTEAEWEYACRAGETTPYRTGNTITTSQANYGNQILNVPFPLTPGTTPVGSYPAENQWGLYDMHGNVWEWCFDWFNEKDYYANSPVQDPPGPASSGTSGGTRVLRGGCYTSDVLAIRSANRFRHIPPYTTNTNGISDYDGLRIACNADF